MQFIKKLIIPIVIASLNAGCGYNIYESDNVAERSAISSNSSDPFWGKELCNTAEYKCIRVYRGDTWAKLFPNEDQRKLIMTLNRTNMALKYRSWIIVPRDVTATKRSLSPFPEKISASNKKKIVISVPKQAYAAYDTNGDLIRWGAVNTGREDGEHHTPRGRFSIYRKQGAECKSSKYPIPTGGSPMPYCMHFYKGYALHEYQMPGFAISHGCVRLKMSDAKWLYSFSPVGTEVIIK